MKRLQSRLFAGAAALAVALGLGASGVASAADIAKRPDPKVCKKIRVTGSHFKQRVCLRKSQWEAQERQARRTMENARSTASGVSSSGGP